MAAAAIPLIEVIGIRVLTAIGLGAWVNSGSDSAKVEQQPHQRTRTPPLVRADTPARARRKCRDCPPDRGWLEPRSTNGWSENSIQYQVRISGFAVGPGTIMEWRYGCTFDGFDSSECLLKESKARYDQFFDDWGQPEPWWAKKDDIVKEFFRQTAAAVPRPPIRLEWFWQQPMSYRFFSKMFQAAAPDVVHHYFP